MVLGHMVAVKAGLFRRNDLLESLLEKLREGQLRAVHMIKDAKFHVSYFQGPYRVSKMFSPVSTYTLFST